MTESADTTEPHDFSQSSDAPNGANASTGPRATDRAEVLLAALGQRFNRATTTTNGQVQRWTARTREELEDLWAEAQALRHSVGTGTAKAPDSQTSATTSTAPSSENTSTEA